MNDVKTRIPKILHQMWLAKDGVDVSEPPTKSYQKNTKDLIRLHPDYEYKWWTNSNTEALFDHPKLIKYKECFLNLKPHICRCDFGRYALLYLYGGIYFDLDFKFLKHFPDDLLDTDILLFHEPKFPRNLISSEQINSGIFKGTRSLANNVLATSPYNDFWLELMDDVLVIYEQQIKSNVVLCTSHGVLNTTGPRKLTNKIYEYVKKNPNTSYNLIDDQSLLFNPLTPNSIAFNDWADGTNWYVTDTMEGQFNVRCFVFFGIFILILAIVLIIIVVRHCSYKSKAKQMRESKYVNNYSSIPRY